MLTNKKSQAMIVDLILLIIISSIFFLFLSNLSAEKSISSASIASQGKYTEKLLLSILDYNNGNGTVAEMIGLDNCGVNLKSEINLTVQQIFPILDTKDSYFILVYGPNKAVYNNLSCVKVEQVSLATFNMSLPCKENVIISLGIWPKSQQVEPC